MRIGWLGASVLLLATGCEGALSDPSAPPFREAPYGAGLELGSSGRKHEFRARGQLLGKIRVSSRGLRVYDEGARRIGRLAVARGGWTLTRADGSQLCAVSVDSTVVVMDCQFGTVSIEGNPERAAIYVDDAEWLRLVSGEGYRTETPGDPSAFGRWSDGAALAVQTHPDAWSHTDVEPAVDPMIALGWTLELPGADAADVRLLGAAIGFLASRELAASSSVEGEPSGIIEPPQSEDASGPDE